MSYTEDPDLWQPETAKVGAIAQNVARARQNHANPAAIDADQRRIDLKTIMGLLSRAANDLRAAERRAVLAEEKAARAEILVREANERLRAAEERAENAEALERKVTAQAVRAFETMKERIALSETKADQAQSHARKVQESSKSALRKIDTHAFEIEKAAKSRNHELVERLRTAETRLEAVRGALGPDQAPRAAFASAAAFLPPADELLSLRVHH